MANTRVYSRSFSGGELSPEMFGRIDDAKFLTGAAELQNFIVTPTGGAKNRAGFAYVKATKNSGVARLIPFTFSLNQTMVVELGAGYARFHTQGETMLYATPQPTFVASCEVLYTIAEVSYFNPIDSNGNAIPYAFTNGQILVMAMSGVAPLGDSVTFPPGIGYGPYTVQNATEYSFSLEDSLGNPVGITANAPHGHLIAQPNYAVGDLASYNNAIYYRPEVPPERIPIGVIDNDPATDGYWYLEPTDLTYEIPTPFQAADLFSIHYVQSADVMTLVHPNYPPQELERLSATTWTMTPISFGPPLATPGGVAVTATAGYLTKIQSVADGAAPQAGNALITTSTNHLLTMGSAVYVKNLTFTPSGGTAQVLDGFYMVSYVPVDSSGNLLNNELYLMDYSGNPLVFLSGGTYSSNASIQIGDQIFTLTNPYAVQAFAADGVTGSLLSASVSVLNNLDVPGSYNTITWEAVTGAQTYYVYKQFNGLWGFIGSTQALSFVDNNIAPDMGITPGTPYDVFSGPGNYPSAVCYFQQRKVFAGTLNDPSNAWLSNSGTENMFSYSIPSLATDAVVFRVAARKADVIQHLMPMLQLILLTSESEYALEAATSSAITPTSVSVNPESYIGSSEVQPTIINTSMLYAAARGGHVREMGYAWTINGYMTDDLSLRAAHLFDTYTIVDQAYSKAPWPIVWFVSSNGNLLGLTYIPEEQIAAWHHHVTEGSFESICCLAEGTEDVLYAVINRTVNGATVRYVERLASRFFTNQADAFFVDAGISQTFVNPVSEISGLTWLEGCTVAVLADGGVQSQKVVTNGAITLDHSASTIQVGLPFTSDLMTLPAVMQLDGFGQGRMKNINKAWVKLMLSSSVLVGPDENHLTEIAQRTNEPWGSPPALQTAELLVMNTPSWQENGQVLIRQQDPLPIEVVGLTLEVSIGG